MERRVENIDGESFEIRESVSGSAIHLSLPVFEGPMDLLLYLIRREEVDIFDIPIARIADEYLRSLEMMQVSNLEIGGEFLVLAATLLSIKARMLLPRPAPLDGESGEEDPRRALVERILEYKAFKESAQLFRSMEESQSNRFWRSATALPIDRENLEMQRALQDVSLFDLLSAFKLAMDRLQEEPARYGVHRFPERIKDRMEFLREKLSERQKIAFSALIGNESSRIAVIVIFLAILELIRLGEIGLRKGKQNDFVLVSKTP